MFKERWSKRALNDFDEIIEFILTKWTAKEALAYIEKVERIISQIRKTPEMFVQSIKGKDIRKCVINKQTSLFYRINGQIIEIITIISNKQNPKKQIIS